MVGSAKDDTTNSEFVDSDYIWMMRMVVQQMKLFLMILLEKLKRVNGLVMMGTRTTNVLKIF